MDILKYGVLCCEATTGKEIIKSSFYFCSIAVVQNKFLSVSVCTGEHVCMIVRREDREDLTFGNVSLSTCHIVQGAPGVFLSSPSTEITCYFCINLGIKLRPQTYKLKTLLTELCPRSQNGQGFFFSVLSCQVLCILTTDQEFV